MNSIQIKIINESNNKLPDYATAGSSGMDLRAFLPAAITIQTLERTLVPTGLFVEIPNGYEAQIRPRSGLAVKQGMTVLNTPGTIDSDYRGEIKVIIVNLSKEEQTINPGDRIAQMVFHKIEKAELFEVKEINVTQRNTGGFGHTGKR